MGSLIFPQQVPLEHIFNTHLCQTCYGYIDMKYHLKMFKMYQKPLFGGDFQAETLQVPLYLQTEKV